MKRITPFLVLALVILSVAAFAIATPASTAKYSPPDKVTRLAPGYWNHAKR